MDYEKSEVKKIEENTIVDLDNVKTII